MVHAVVAEKRVFPPVKAEASACNTVADTSHDRAEVSVSLIVAFKAIVPAHKAQTVKAQIGNGRAEVKYCRRQRPPAQGVGSDSSAVRQLSENFRLYSAHRFSLRIRRDSWTASGTRRGTCAQCRTRHASPAFRRQGWGRHSIRQCRPGGVRPPDRVPSCP